MVVLPTTVASRAFLPHPPLSIAAMFLVAVFVMAMWPEGARFGTPSSSIAQEGAGAASADMTAGDMTLLWQAMQKIAADTGLQTANNGILQIGTNVQLNLGTGALTVHTA